MQSLAARQPNAGFSIAVSCPMAAAAVLLWACGSGLAAAQTLQPQAGLTVVYGGTSTLLSPAQLLALPQHSTATATPWTDGVVRFQGPLVADALKAAGVSLRAGMKVQATALNGYAVDIPAQDFLRWPVLLAFSMDGKQLTRRDKGPLWIVYPRDSDKQLQDAQYDHRWAWQLQQLRIGDAP